MPPRKSTDYQPDDPRIQEAIDAFHRHGSRQAAALHLGVPRQTIDCRVKHGLANDYKPSWDKPFEMAELPDEIAPVEEIIERRKREFQLKEASEKARKLIAVKVKIDGPIAIVHWGDPHTDDPGTDWPAIERHVEICNSSPAIFAANIGDLQNSWVGRLAHLWGQQSTSKAEAWKLTEWLVSSVSWLYILAGNHDLWNGEGDPVKWIIREHQGIYEAHGARIELQFPNGKKVRVNARHDFTGSSIWNVTHGPSRAVQQGWRDHIVTCGHKHTSGYQVLKCPATGLISHVLRVAGYKKYDRYAKEKGLPDQNIFPSAVTVIDPEYEDDDPRLITTLFDVERGAQFLKMLRA